MSTTPGQVAYEAWWRNYSRGLTENNWSDQSSDPQAAWEAAARAVQEQVADERAKLVAMLEQVTDELSERASDVKYDWSSEPPHIEGFECFMCNAVTDCEGTHSIQHHDTCLITAARKLIERMKGTQ